MRGGGTLRKWLWKMHGEKADEDSGYLHRGNWLKWAGLNGKRGSMAVMGAFFRALDATLGSNAECCDLLRYMVDSESGGEWESVWSGGCRKRAWAWFEQCEFNAHGAYTTRR